MGITSYFMGHHGDYLFGGGYGRMYWLNNPLNRNTGFHRIHSLGSARVIYSINIEHFDTTFVQIDVMCW